MITFITIDNDWDIVTSDAHNYGHYARHSCENPGDRWWMSIDEKECRGCKERVPDHIKTILVLLGWDS